MRYVSESFKEIQDELVRPALQMYFEVDTNVANTMRVAVDPGVGTLGLDYDYVPIVAPKTCVNEHYYAVLGDEVGVDDPNRICAPAIPNGVGTYDMPDTTVPFGITVYRRYNYEGVIGVTSPYYENFNNFDTPATLSFKGGLIPEQVRVLHYDTNEEAWLEETTILNPELKEEIVFTPVANQSDFRMFLPKNTTKSGRYQFNWLRRNRGSGYNPPRNPIVFENNLISSINITQETDLTSQTLPTYEMTVECLDVDEIYTPESDYFKNQFKDGTPCYLKVGFEIDGEIEYIPFMFGKLTQAPSYSEGAISFSVAVDFCKEWNVEFSSNANRDLNVGDEVENISFANINSLNDLFDIFDIFKDQDDETASVCNYNGEVEQNDARQMIANALGGYITAGVNTFNLHSTNGIQYKTAVDNVTRYEQIQATLESQPKVGKIVITRNENTLSGTNTVQLTPPERVYIHADETVFIPYELPFYAIGKFIVNDYQKSVSDAVVGTDYGILNESINEDGKIVCDLVFSADRNTYVQPIVTFYGVDNKQFKETSYYNDGEGELYENNNELVTNTYISDKVKRVARLINDIPNQYEVDVVQDYRYELGDIIRLETQTGVFKTCVITGLSFAMPGSSGHITCRKIFSIADVSVAHDDVVGATITFPDDDIVLTILETNGKPVVIGKCYDPVNDETTYLMLNVKRYKTERAGEEPVISSTLLLVVDNNDVGWKMCFFTDSVGDAEIPAGCLTLPDYHSDYGILPIAYCGIAMIEKVYAEQEMTAPVDYGCEVDYIPVE